MKIILCMIALSLSGINCGILPHHDLGFDHHHHHHDSLSLNPIIVDDVHHDHHLHHDHPVLHYDSDHLHHYGLHDHHHDHHFNNHLHYHHSHVVPHFPSYKSIHHHGYGWGGKVKVIKYVKGGWKK